jgi:hypothetical protein
MRNESLYVVLSLSIVESLKNKNRSHKQTVQLIREICTILSDLPPNKQNDGLAYSIAILKDISKGPDGLVGTEDDLIDPKFVEELSDLSKSSMLEDLIHIFTKPPKSWASRMFMCYKNCI